MACGCRTAVLRECLLFRLVTGACLQKCAGSLADWQISAAFFFPPCCDKSSARRYFRVPSRRIALRCAALHCSAVLETDWKQSHQLVDLLRPLGSLRRVCFTRLSPQICAYPWSRLSCRFELEDSYYIFLSSSLSISQCFVSSFGFARRLLQRCVSRCKCLRFPGSNAGNCFQSLGFQVIIQVLT